MPIRQRHKGGGKEPAPARCLGACCRAHLSSLNSICGGKVRDYSDAAIAAGMFWYIALCEGKLASLPSD